MLCLLKFDSDFVFLQHNRGDKANIAVQVTLIDEAHCRMIGEAPFNMYLKAGYNVVKTDSFLILLMLQRRKHLMCKKIPDVRVPLESDEEWT